MINAVRFPLSLLTVFFVIGIIAANCIIPPLAILLWTGIACIILLMFFSAYVRTRPKKLFLVPVLSTFTALIMGGIVFLSHHWSNDPNHFLKFARTDNHRYGIEAEIAEKLKTTPYYERYICQVRRLDSRPVTGRILLNVKRDSSSIGWVPGNRLLIRAVIASHAKPLNPEQFNYGNYLDNKSVHAQLRVSAADVIALKQDHKNVLYYAGLIRKRIITQLELSGFRTDELNVILALVLGQQQEISQAVLQDYQFAGAVHILSVSGLHVGFILVFLNFFLNRLPHSKARRYIKLAAVLIGLWGFAVIAGLSPSVVRSVTMFSFVALGMHMRRETNIFHTLMVSMLLILTVRPAFLFDVGFQLSFVSLFFILWVQPILAGFYVPKNAPGRYFMNILTVSVAAQLGAMPLSIFYFHQFPGLFFVTNLVILPFIGVIMGTGIVIMLLALINFTPHFLMISLQTMITILNRIIHLIAEFESFVIKDIPMNTAILLTCYLAIIYSVYYVANRRANRLLFMLGTIILLQFTVLGSLRSNTRSSELIVFNSPKSTLLAHRSGKNISVMISDSITPAQMKYSISPFAVAKFCNSIRIQPLQNTAFLERKRILRIDSSFAAIPCQPDILLLTQSPRINLERMLRLYQPEVVVADASNYKTYIECWEKTCRKLNIKFHATPKSGYYRIAAD